MALHGDRSDPVAVFLNGLHHRQEPGLCGITGQCHSVRGSFIQACRVQIVCRLPPIVPTHAVSMLTRGHSPAHAQCQRMLHSRPSSTDKAGHATLA
jgi:hypothetical protein